MLTQRRRKLLLCAVARMEPGITDADKGALDCIETIADGEGVHQTILSTYDAHFNMLFHRPDRTPFNVGMQRLMMHRGSAAMGDAAMHAIAAHLHRGRLVEHLRAAFEPWHDRQCREHAVPMNDAIRELAAAALADPGVGLVLADALEEAGCTDAYGCKVFREHGAYRGMWLLDKILRKEEESDAHCRDEVRPRGRPRSELR